MTGENRQLDAKEISVGRLLNDGDYEFVIPEYQRPYAWGVEETLQLLSDLLGALERDTDEPYFLGSVVLVKDPSNPRAEVIDGQQRLTTLTLLLSLLRDLATDDELRRDIHKLIEEPAVGWEDKAARPRLALRPRDNQFFLENVQQQGGTLGLVGLSDNIPETDAQRGLRDNAKALYEELQSLTSDLRKDLFRLIARRAFLVIVATPDLNSAYRIFSVMNARGLPLSPQDTFKSQIIGAIPEEQKQHYADRWERLEEDLGRDEFGDLFLYIRAIKARTRSVKSLLQEFPQQVLNVYLPDNGIGFMKEVLEPYAKANIRLNAQDFQGDVPLWEQINNWLKRLAQLDNDDWRPPALWAITEHGEDPEFLVAFFSKLERLAASMLVRRVYATPRQQRYMELLKQLADGHGLDSHSFELTEIERAETWNASTVTSTWLRVFTSMCCYGWTPCWLMTQELPTITRSSRSSMFCPKPSIPIASGPRTSRRKRQRRGRIVLGTYCCSTAGKTPAPVITTSTLRRRGTSSRGKAWRCSHSPRRYLENRCGLRVLSSDVRKNFLKF